MVALERPPGLHRWRAKPQTRSTRYSVSAPSTTCCATTRAATSRARACAAPATSARPKGEHITLVDDITGAVEKPIRNRPRERILLVTLGSGRNKVTATFFNPRNGSGIASPKDTRVMLSGEVGFFRGAMQLTHPGVSRPRLAGRQEPRQPVAEKHRRRLTELSAARCCKRRSNVASTRSIRPAPNCRAGTFSTACVRCSRSSTRCADPLPKELCAKHNLISEDEALRAIHLAEDDARAAARPRASGLRRGRRAAVGAGEPPPRRAVRVRAGGADASRRADARTVAALAIRADRRPA